MSESLVRQNERLLTHYELGGLVLDAYDAALVVDPRLSEMAILPLDPARDASSLATAAPKWWAQPHRDAHQIRLRLGDPVITLRGVEAIVRRSPTSYSIIAERLGLQFKDMSPRLTYIFSTLHEMGHVSQYFDYETKPGAFNKAVAAERRTLPYSFAAPSALATAGSPERNYVSAHWNDIQLRTGAADLDELITMQSIAYRNMPTEAGADYFAAEVLADNPDLMNLLLAE